MSLERNHSQENERLNRAAGTVGFFTFLSRILGLVRDMVVAFFFGSGMAADAFFVAFRIPNLLRRLFAEGSLTIAFIPIFTEYLHNKSREEAFQLARIILTLLSAILIIVTILGIMFSPWIVRFQAWGFGSGTKYELTVLLTRITFPYIFCISLIALFMGILNSLRHFAAPAASPIFLNVGIIASALLISPRLSEPVVGLAWGVLIGGVLQILLQLPWLFKRGVSLLPLWMPKHPAVRRIGLLMVPAIFGSAVYQFNSYIGLLLASFLPQGSVSWLYYADRLVQFPLGVFSIAFSTAALPTLSAQMAGNQFRDFENTLGHSLRMIFFITFPSMAGLIVLGQPIIRLLFERGRFDAFSTTMTQQALIYYTMGLWAFSGVRIAVAAFYAHQDTKTPVKVAVVTAVLNIIFSLILMRFLQHGGLALGLSLASSFQFVLLLFLLKRRLPEWNLMPIVNSAVKSLAASVIMGAGVYILFKWLISSTWTPAGLLWQILFLGISVVFGSGIYFTMTGFFRCPELGDFVKIVRPS